MTQQEIAAQKRTALTLLYVGIAALICSYAVGYAGPHTSVTVLVQILMTAIFLGCIFVAGMKAMKLGKEKSAK
jgi:hypothetical protein